MKRTSAQVLGEWAEEYAIAIFMEYGWIAERCQRDYGLDLFVQPTDVLGVTAQFALVQVKARTSKSAKRNQYRIRIASDHLRFWEQIPLPVYLAVVHPEPKELYLVNLHNFIEACKETAGEHWPRGTTAFVTFPEDAKVTPRRMQVVRREIAERYRLLAQAVRTLAGRRNHPYLWEPIPTEEEHRAAWLIHEWATEISRFYPLAQSVDRVAEALYDEHSHG
jgi:hypothetical protein